jgi:hypothetical protein
MMVLFVAVAGLVLAAVLALWPISSGTKPERQREKHRRWLPQEPSGRFRGVAPVTAHHAEPGAEPTTLEGILTGQRLRGEISQLQYLRALENLAARDEERHPMILRWDDRPGAWS